MASWKPTQNFFQKQIRGNIISLNPQDILQIPECQPRVDGTDEKLVAEYAQDMRDYDAFYADHDPPIQGWQKFPRISCVHDPKVGYILFSGNHRLEAILQVGYSEVEIHYFTGTRQDAIVLSKKENADNGKRRTNADKAHVVRSCLLDPELKLWSNRTIAKWCGVDHKTVASHEKALGKIPSGNDEPYTRPTRRKRLSNTGEIEWVETASIGNGNPEKPNRKELKRKHHSAMVNVQSAFFDADLHEHESFSHLPDVETGKKAQEFFRRTAFVRRRELRPDIFESMHTNSYLHETGKALTNAEIEAEIEVLKKIADQTRWYGKSEDAHLGWIESVLEMEPEPQETEDEEQVWERYKDAEKGMWQALWAKKAQVHAQNFITAACDAHLNWGVSNFPKNANAAEADGMLEIWTARFDLVTTEINIGSEWVTTFLESDYSDPGSEAVEVGLSCSNCKRVDSRNQSQVPQCFQDLNGQPYRTF